MSIFDGGIIGVVSYHFKLLGLAFLPFFAFFGLGLNLARSWGTSRTVLAAETRPPWRFPIVKATLYGVGFVFVGIFFLLMAHDLVPQLKPLNLNLYMNSGLVLLICIAAAVILLGHVYNERVWKPKEAVWQRSFLCRRCGAVFAVPEFDPVGENPVRSDKAGKGGLLPLSGAPETRQAARAKAESDDILLRKKRY
ncbi:hypothetical protein [Pelomicrobium methylotrophicum]|uniref:Uncharacterized protein n=1 Tax=Pelomicrobium methylotrophicum TaxID=2602750 RepID=A0A5C7EKL1_9PROT|nr:hypothetical protein [Pelomicrobium methylotrophicum]TXF11578.1 hypothetical protein FR698_09570 [Pelomicrobium methylotrophicum]